MRPKTDSFKFKTIIRQISAHHVASEHKNRRVLREVENSDEKEGLEGQYTH
jgi:hypothetical protein